MLDSVKEALKRWLQRIVDSKGTVLSEPSYAGATLKYIAELEALVKNPTPQIHEGNDHWQDSYTKSVVDRLGAYAQFQSIGSPVRAAMALLKDYHDTQHVVYEQRDRANANAKDWFGVATRIGERGKAVTAELKEMRQRWVRAMTQIGQLENCRSKWRTLAFRFARKLTAVAAALQS